MNSVRKRLVFDTSSLVPVCLHPNREPARIFRRTILDHEVYASRETFSELVAVLSRAKFEAWQPLNQRLAWIKFYQAAVAFVEVNEKVQDCRDEKDNKFLGLALAAKADVLVSSDVHLLELNPYRGLAILSLQQFKETHCAKQKP